MYADNMTDSMKSAIDETNRRRAIQMAYNEEHHIIPKTIKKEIREAIHGQETLDQAATIVKKAKKVSKKAKKQTIEELEKQMREAAKALDFERAMALRDAIQELRDAS